MSKRYECWIIEWYNGSRYVPSTLIAQAFAAEWEAWRAISNRMGGTSAYRARLYVEAA